MTRSITRFNVSVGEYFPSNDDFAVLVVMYLTRFEEIRIMVARIIHLHREEVGHSSAEKLMLLRFTTISVADIGDTVKLLEKYQIFTDSLTEQERRQFDSSAETIARVASRWSHIRDKVAGHTNKTSLRNAMSNAASETADVTVSENPLQSEFQLVELISAAHICGKKIVRGGLKDLFDGPLMTELGEVCAAALNIHDPILSAYQRKTGRIFQR